MEHVHLGSLDLVISVFLVPESVLIEPVIDLSLNIEWVTEVGGSGRSNPVHVAVGSEEIVSQFLASSLIVFLENTEATDGSYNK